MGKVDWGDVAVESTTAGAAGTSLGLGPWGTIGAGGGMAVISILNDIFGKGDGGTYNPYIYNPDMNVARVGGLHGNSVTAPADSLSDEELYRILLSDPEGFGLTDAEIAILTDTTSRTQRFTPVDGDEERPGGRVGGRTVGTSEADPNFGMGYSVDRLGNDVRLAGLLKSIRARNPDLPTGETFITSGAQDTQQWLNDAALYFLNNPQVEIDQSDYDYDRQWYIGMMDEILKPQWGFTEEAQSIQDQIDAMNNAIGGYGRHINDLSDIIRGNAPSVAQLEREKAMEQTQRMALSQAASSRDPGAWRAAMDVGSEAANSAAMDAAIIRAKEIESALGLRSDALAGRSDAYADLTGAYSELTNVYDQWGNLIQDHGDSWLKFSELDQQAARDRVDAEIKDLETRLQTVQELMRLGFDYGAEEARLLTQLEIAKVNASVGINTAQTEVYLGDVADTREDKAARDKALSAGLETIFETLPIKPKEDEPFIPDQPVQGSPDPNLPDGDPKYVRPKPLDN